MKRLPVVLSLLAMMGASIPLLAQGTTAMTNHAQGEFDVKVIPQPADDSAGGPFGRLFLDKRFHGDLVATSKGQMLGTGTPDQGTAGYVALELVSGTLGGRRGSFVLQHSGTMQDGDMTLHVTVVPGSGTDELVGLAGTMTIIIEGAKHSYAFAYSLGGSSPGAQGASSRR